MLILSGKKGCVKDKTKEKKSRRESAKDVRQASRFAA
jgi:hypothetical protein